ncbi:hypothetical protein HPB52_010412 [Rhipicephalus sanguineus]|uniref:CCHC-type domain-containing protein n=1 Tax=Rhipicephalus sanguineus TaxID=34632 RepID=A0A9D4T9C4_RHISA|nr:hypothetical protein HPB52_010412 [Rhipicephalus sanguineus]
MAGSASAPLLSTPGVSNPAEGGEDDEIQAMEGTEWQVFQSKSTKKKQAVERGTSQPNASRSSQGCVQLGARSSRRAAALKKRVIAASRMPELPSTHRKIIVRPRDGLDLRKTSCYGISTAIFTAAGITAIQASSDLVCPNVVQNIVVVCTEKEDNARKILALKNIRVNGKEHEVAVYAAAEGNYVKGVIRNVERDIGDTELERLIVHQGNPSVRGVKRIKDTGSVVVLFDGDVPGYIRVGQAIVRCYLYKKQMEVCSKCTRVGHRADVCPTPMVNVCHSCGAKDPKQGHSCLLRCKLCGKGHTTGDKACKQKYQTPFVIRQRRKEREMERAFDMDLRFFPTLGVGLPRPPSGGWLQPFTVGGGSALPVTAKWASKAQNPETYRTQAGPSTQVSGGTVTANESEELKKVRNENAKLSSDLAQVKKELAPLKNAVSASRQDGDQNGANDRKRRAVGDVPEVDVADSLNQIKESLKLISSTLQEITKDIVIVKAQNRFVAAVVDMSGRTVSAASVRTRSIGAAEQVAISLALTNKDPCPIFSNSMTAVKSSDATQISLAAHSILTKSTIFPHELTWFPAHMGAPVDGITKPNEVAHARARGLILRPGQTSPPAGCGGEGEPVKRSGTFGSRPLRGRCPPRVFRNPRPSTQ